MNKELNKRIDELLTFALHGNCDDLSDYMRSEQKKTVKLVQQALQEPTLEELKEQIIKIVNPHYENWYQDFIKIEIDDTGVYAVCEDIDHRNENVRFIIFKIIDDFMETSTCSHLKLEHIDLITTYFMRLESNDEK